MLLLVLLIIVCCLLECEGAPKKKKGSSGWFGSSKKKNNDVSSYGSHKKSKKMKNLKKAAIVGAGVYAGYQIGKATSRFGGYRHGGHWGFNDYNRWREQDGMLCRSSLDCTWMDQNMQCEDYELDFSMNRGWFGGDYLAIVGECECRDGMRWDNWELRCENSFFAMLGGALLVVLLVLLCCCCGCCAGVAYCFFRRK